MLFGDGDPSEIGYFTADGDEYGKAVLRQAQRYDTHVYAILTARITCDIAQLRSFVRQDNRIEGQKYERFEQRWQLASKAAMDMAVLTDEGADCAEEVEDVLESLVEDDKR